MTSTSPPPRRLAAAAYVAAIAVAVLLPRVALWWDVGWTNFDTEARGIASDLAVSLLGLWIVAWLPSKVARVALAVLTMILGTVTYFNFEHVIALGGAVDFRNASFLGEGAFVLGSVLRPSHPGWFLATIGLPLLLILLAGQFPFGRRWRVFGIILPLAIFGNLTARRLTWDQPTWRQFNVLHENVHASVRAAWFAWRRDHSSAQASTDRSSDLRELTPAERATAAVQVDRMLALDLTGEPRVVLPRQSLKPVNVLVVQLEGLSGAYFRSLADDFNFDDAQSLKRSDAVLKDWLVFRNFVGHNRQTHRGQYATYCGDIDNLVDHYSKAWLYMTSPDAGHVCFPEALRRKGYRTSYIQPTEITFVGANRFFRRYGMEEVFGYEWFKKTFAWERWGANDLNFFDETFQKLVELRDGGRPWLLGLMTVGTHHPFVVDPEFKSERPDRTMGRAVDYLDAALAPYLERLKAAGVYDDTLVIVTADEANAMSGGDFLRGLASQNWLPLFIHTPAGDRGVVSDTFAQMDLGVSVLDYLGIDPKPYGLKGRSVFRRYETERLQAVANVHAHKVGFYDPGTGRLVYCGPAGNECQAFTGAEARLVPSSWSTPVSDVVGDEAIVRELLARNEREEPKITAGATRALALPGRVNLASAGRVYRLAGYQFLPVPAGWTWSAVFEVRAAHGEATVSTFLRDADAALIREFPAAKLAEGKTLRLAFEARADAPVGRLEVEVNATAADAGAEVEVTEATFTYVADPDAEGAYGVHRALFETR